MYWAKCAGVSVYILEKVDMLPFRSSPKQVLVRGLATFFKDIMMVRFAEIYEGFQ